MPTPVTTTATATLHIVQILRAKQRRRATSESIVYKLDVNGFPRADVTAAHFHRGNGSVNGPIVAVLTPDGRFHTLSNATAVIALLDADELYVNVHTAAFPAGFLRGRVQAGWFCLFVRLLFSYYFFRG